MSEKHLVDIAHSPDSDDAFMFYALAKGKVSSEIVDFHHVLSDIQTLNVANNGILDFLPDDACIEVNCTILKTGPVPVPVQIYFLTRE